MIAFKFTTPKSYCGEIVYGQTNAEQIIQRDSKDSVPDKLCCPVTRRIMHFPSRTIPGGRIYDQETIDSLTDEENRDPYTRQIIDDYDLEVDMMQECRKFIKENWKIAYNPIENMITENEALVLLDDVTDISIGGVFEEHPLALFTLPNINILMNADESIVKIAVSQFFESREILSHIIESAPKFEQPELIKVREQLDKAAHEFVLKKLAHSEFAHADIAHFPVPPNILAFAIESEDVALIHYLESHHIAVTPEVINYKCSLRGKMQIISGNIVHAAILSYVTGTKLLSYAYNKCPGNLPCELYEIGASDTLTLAISMRNEYILEKLLHCATEVHLRYAISLKSLDIIARILDNIKLAEISETSSHEIVQSACSSGLISIIEKLPEKLIADYINKQDLYGRNGFHNACLYGENSFIITLYRKFPHIDLHQKDLYDYEPLDYVTLNGGKSAILAEIQRGTKRKFHNLNE